MNPSRVGTCHSAAVRLDFIVGDRAFELAVIKPESAFLRSPVLLPLCEREIMMRVHGRATISRVNLTDGFFADSPHVRTQQVFLSSRLHLEWSQVLNPFVKRLHV